jgi:drug/metabolite transporter (DMT)-like permease
VFLKVRVEPRVFAGAILGVAGTAVIFQSELTGFVVSRANLLSLVICVLSVVSASIGNVLSAYLQRRRIPVMQSNALGMTYGATLLLVLALALGKQLTIDTRPAYLLSLAYLAVFGSVVAFGAFLKLIGNIGPDKAAYTILIIPIIALLMSSMFEGFAWTGSAFLGLFLILAGNTFALTKTGTARRAHPQRLDASQQCVTSPRSALSDGVRQRLE